MSDKFRRKNTHTLLDSLDLTDEVAHNSVEIDCLQEEKFLLMYDITETGAIANGDIIGIQVQFREDGGTWRNYTNGPFGALYEEQSTTPCNTCVSGQCDGEKMRVVVTATYTGSGDPTNIYFTVTVEATLRS